MTEERQARNLSRPVSAEVQNDSSSAISSLATPLLSRGGFEWPQPEEVDSRIDIFTDPTSRRRPVPAQIAETPGPEVPQPEYPQLEEPQNETVHSKTDTGIDSSSSRLSNFAKIFSAWQNLANKYWIYELSSSLISVLALAGLCAVLGSFNGHARPKLPAYVSINIIIAITTVILKASMMLSITESISELKWQWFIKPQSLIDVNTFDSASRGPWGSFLFLFNFRKHLLATFGAVITICVLAIDPFSQQVLNYRDCFEPNDSLTAEIPVTNRYTHTGGHIGVDDSAMDPVLMLGIYNGFLSLSQNGSSLVPVTCSSENCTFASDNGATYSSIAICHRSQDITHHIQNDTLADGWRNYSLPTGSRLDQAILLSSVVVNSENSAEGEDDPNMFFTFDALMISVNLTHPTGGLPFAVRSSIYPCVKTWGANITSNEFRETKISSVFMEFNTKTSHSYLANQTLRNGTWQACNPTSHMTDVNTVSVTKYPPPTSDERSSLDADTYEQVFVANNIENGTTLWYPFDCTWMFGGDNFRAIFWFFYGLFDHNHITPAMLYPQGDLWLQNLYMNGTANMSTVNDYINRLASSMTATIRSHGDPVPAPYTNYASGVVLENQTCIYVRWGWLALPASLVLCSITFLAATITLTSAKRSNDSTKAWIAKTGPLKSSPLPLLFHGIEPSTLMATGHPNDLNNMQRLAKTLDVRLGQSSVDGNWYFLHDQTRRKLVKSPKPDV